MLDDLKEFRVPYTITGAVTVLARDAGEAQKLASMDEDRWLEPLTQGDVDPVFGTPEEVC